MSTPPATTTALVRFLVARVDEDTEELRRLQRRLTRATSRVEDHDGVRSLDRQRAECAAKRQVLGQAQHLLVLRDLPAEKDVRDTALLMLRALAQPYADHYGYRPEWRG